LSLVCPNFCNSLVTILCFFPMPLPSQQLLLSSAHL
jgi:hypothetical protein